MKIMSVILVLADSRKIIHDSDSELSEIINSNVNFDHNDSNRDYTHASVHNIDNITSSLHFS